MAKAYIQDFKAQPDQPGFWIDDWLTGYGCAVVRHTDGKLYALGWSAQPVPIMDLPNKPMGSRRTNPKDDTNVYQAGWYGPMPVPSERRYEIRRLKEQFRCLGPE